MNKHRLLTLGISSLLALPALAAERNWIGNGAPGDWNDPLNWDTGVPTTGTGDNVYVRLPGNILAPAIDMGVLRIAVGTPGVPASSFTFGAGTFNIGEIQVADAFNGLNPGSNLFGRVFIQAGTTINVANNFFVGERAGGTGEVQQSGGDVNVFGQFRVGHWPQADVGAGTASKYILSGGSLTVHGDPADPFAEGQAGNVFLGIDSTGILIVNGGTFTAKGITFDNRASTAGEDTLEINGGTVNLGANGLASQNAAIPSTYKIRLGGGVLRATASWSTNMTLDLVPGTGIQIDTNSNTVTFSNNVVGTGSLTKVGGGTLILTGANSYSGGTIINGGVVEIGNGGTLGSLGTGAVAINGPGTLIYQRSDAGTISGAVSGNGNLTVNSGALRLANAAGTFITSVAPATTFGAAGTLGLVSVGNGGTLEAGFGGSGDMTASQISIFAGTLKVNAGTSNTKFVVTGNDGFNVIGPGQTTIQVNPVNLAVGSYTLVDYTGAIGGLGFAGLSIAGLPVRAVGGLVNNTGNTSVDLSITAIDSVRWIGGTSGDWDTTTAGNWNLVIAGGPTNYLNLDAVLFDNVGSEVVNLTTTLTPSSITINHAAPKVYSFVGVGGISGDARITKQGTGRAIIGNSGFNDFTGPIDVQGGILQVGDGFQGSLPAASSVTIASGAIVELNLSAPYLTPTTGPGFLRTIGSNIFDIGPNVLTSPIALIISGDAFHAVNLANQPALNGSISVEEGTLRATGPQALGTAVGSTMISNGGTLDVNGLDLGAEQILVSGTGANGTGAIVNHGPGTVFNLHKVTLTGDAAFGGSQRWDIRATGIPGEILDLAGFKLTKIGPNQVSLVEIDMTPGNIDINEGTFSIEAGSDVHGPGTIRLNFGGTLGLWVNQPGRLDRPIVAAGGTISELGSGGATTVDSPITMEQNLAYNPNGANTVLTQTAPMVESGGPRTLSINGGGRLILLGNNTWTGGTNIINGILQIGNGGANGTLGTGPSVNTGTLDIAKNNLTTIDGSINPGNGVGNLFLRSGGTTTLAPGTDVGAFFVSFGLNGVNDAGGHTLNIGPNTSLTIGDSLHVGNSGGGGSLILGTVHQTGGAVTVNAPGTDGRQFVLGHWNSTEGIYNLSGGTLTSPNISMSISWDGEGTFNLSGGLADVKGLRFGHNGARTGRFNLTGGQLNLGVDGIWQEFGGTPNDINLGGGIVRATTSTVINLPVELTGTNGDVTFDTNGFTLNVNGDLSGPGGFTKTGNGRMVLNAANSATGIFLVTGGTLSLVGAHVGNRIPAGGTVIIGSGATLEFGSVNVAAFTANYSVSPGGILTTAAGVEHVHLGNVTLAGGVWTTDAATGSYNGENYYLLTGVTVNGSVPSTITQQGGTTADRGIGWGGSVNFDVGDVTVSPAADLIVSTELEDSDAGPATLIKLGFGTMEVTLANTYSGGTILNAGTLLVNNTVGSGVGTGPVNVAAGARLAGNGFIGSGTLLSVALSGKLAPGSNGPGVLSFHLGGGSLDLSGAVAAPATGNLEFELGATSDAVVVVSGTLAIGTGALEIDDFAFTFGGGFGVGDYLLFNTSVPIVGTLGPNVSGPIAPGFTGTLEYIDGTNDLRLHVVPEPASALLLLGGLALLTARRGRAGAPRQP